MPNESHSGLFVEGAFFTGSHALWEFAQKPEFRVRKAMLIQGFHGGLENFANRTLLLRSEGLLHGTVRARKGGAIFRISLSPCRKVRRGVWLGSNIFLFFSVPDSPRSRSVRSDSVHRNRGYGGIHSPLPHEVPHKIPLLHYLCWNRFLTYLNPTPLWF